MGLLAGVLAAFICFPVVGRAQVKPADNSTSAAELPKPHIDHQALEKLGWRLGCQAWTFRELTLFQTIDLLHNLGIRYIELYPGQKLSPEHPDVKFDHNSPPEYVEAVKEKLKSSGVTAISYGVVQIGNDEAQARKVFDFAKAMGLENVVSEPPPDAFDMLDKLTAEYKINLAIHDHPKPSRYWNCESVVKVCKNRSKRIGACADVGHWYRSGLTPLDCIKKLKGRIIESHFKDISKDKKDVVWGTGEVDCKAILAELKRQGARPFFAIEYEHGQGRELIDNVCKSIDNFSKMIEEIEHEQ
jgi:sugar phosphate isomerase/epimerase